MVQLSRRSGAHRREEAGVEHGAVVPHWGWQRQREHVLEGARLEDAHRSLCATDRQPTSVGTHGDTVATSSVQIDPLLHLLLRRVEMHQHAGFRDGVEAIVDVCSGEADVYECRSPMLLRDRRRLPLEGSCGACAIGLGPIRGRTLRSRASIHELPEHHMAIARCDEALSVLVESDGVDLLCHPRGGQHFAASPVPQQNLPIVFEADGHQHPGSRRRAESQARDPVLVRKQFGGSTMALKIPDNHTRALSAFANSQEASVGGEAKRRHGLGGAKVANLLVSRGTVQHHDRASWVGDVSGGTQRYRSRALRKAASRPPWSQLANPAQRDFEQLQRPHKPTCPASCDGFAGDDSAQTCSLRSIAALKNGGKIPPVRISPETGIRYFALIHDHFRISVSALPFPNANPKRTESKMIPGIRPAPADLRTAIRYRAVQWLDKADAGQSRRDVRT
eukprot:scaffold817_cov246-Pinguiococcus_pyrenoidosus.AAC.9